MDLQEIDVDKKIDVRETDLLNVKKHVICVLFSFHYVMLRWWEYGQQLFPPSHQQSWLRTLITHLF